MGTIRQEARRRFLQLLDADSLARIESRVLMQVKDAARKQRTRWPPVRLSEIAPYFQLLPRPEYVIGAPEGSIRYRPDTRDFVISLGAPHQAHAVSRASASTQGGLYLRHRFTYAHEFAHRFFFIETPVGWRRAIDIVVEETERRHKGSVYAGLAHQEEECCNRVARQILVPESELRFAVEKLAYGGTSPNAWFDILPNLLAIGSRMFHVSRQVIANSLTPSTLNMPPPEGAAAGFVLKTARKGSGDRGTRDLRFFPFIWPGELSGTQVLPPFPGIAATNLGADFAIALAEALQSRARSLSTIISSRIRPSRMRGECEIRSRLDARICVYSATPGHEEFLLWGFLK